MRPPLAVGDLFDVTPGDRDDIVFEGGSERLDFLGSGLDRGRDRREGDAGGRRAAACAAGHLRVSGSVGRGRGPDERRDGSRSAGDAGDWLGGALPGELSGMSGGLVSVRGGAGARAGDRMRRGLIASRATRAHTPASRMIAGTCSCSARVRRVIPGSR